MTMRLTCVGLLLVAACSPEPRVVSRKVTDDPRPAAPVPAPTPAPLASLSGEWRIAAIDGKDFNEAYALTLSGDAREIWWTPRCAGLIRSYTIDGSAIRIGPAVGVKPPAPGQPTPPVCAIGLPPRLDEVVRAIDSATGIARTANNGIELSGGGRSLLLFSQ